MTVTVSCTRRRRHLQVDGGRLSDQQLHAGSRDGREALQLRGDLVRADAHGNPVDAALVGHGFERVARRLVHRRHRDAGQHAARRIGDRAGQRRFLREGGDRSGERQAAEIPDEANHESHQSSCLGRTSFELDLLSCRGHCAGVVDDSSAHHRHHRLDVLDLIRRNREVVAIQHDEVRELARLDRAEVVLLEDEERVPPRVRDQRVLAADRLPRSTPACRRPSCRSPPTHSVVNGMI